MAGSGDPPGSSSSTNPTGNSLTTGNTSGPSTQPTSTLQPPDPVAAALNATAPQVSFSPDQLQAIMQTLATLYQGQQGAAAPTPPTATPAVITAAAFPQFVFAPANLAPAGKSLLDLFPSIEGSVLLEIARHKFRPGDLYTTGVTDVAQVPLLPPIPLSSTPTFHFRTTSFSSPSQFGHCR
ncbi:hypothetical protein BD311DRAFT_810040 [Dichomitus squalens]|uniref:Uncharacterized protein n=1 Tax=Dichomitus squalens TaxID=114155 RepID=A0A4Q9MAX1_9APHY|nr:hypothetical protein BD311DRAFT_810040 [Dichomitus squalens]